MEGFSAVHKENEIGCSSDVGRRNSTHSYLLLVFKPLRISWQNFDLLVEVLLRCIDGKHCEQVVSFSFPLWNVKRVEAREIVLYFYFFGCIISLVDTRGEMMFVE